MFSKERVIKHFARQSDLYRNGWYQTGPNVLNWVLIPQTGIKMTWLQNGSVTKPGSTWSCKPVWAHCTLLPRISWRTSIAVVCLRAVICFSRSRARSAATTVFLLYFFLVFLFFVRKLSATNHVKRHGVRRRNLTGRLWRGTDWIFIWLKLVKGFSSGRGTYQSKTPGIPALLACHD